MTFFVEWPWLHPLTCILRLGGWTIDEVVTRPRAAAELRVFWKLWKASERLSRERERRNEIDEASWWRSQGCPVPCPLCGAVESCVCRPARCFASLKSNAG